MRVRCKSGTTAPANPPRERIQFSQGRIARRKEARNRKKEAAPSGGAGGKINWAARVGHDNLNVTKGGDMISFAPGDKIKFDARIDKRSLIRSAFNIRVIETAASKAAAEAKKEQAKVAEVAACRPSASLASHGSTPRSRGDKIPKQASSLPSKTRDLALSRASSATRGYSFTCLSARKTTVHLLLRETRLSSRLVSRVRVRARYRFASFPLAQSSSTR